MIPSEVSEIADLMVPEGSRVRISDMLAQNFIGHKTLGITEVEHGALIQVLGMLERDELVHGRHLARQPRGPNEFNMASALDENEDGCGTVACICGWAHVVSDRIAFADIFRATTYATEGQAINALPSNLIKLFRFGTSLGNLSHITPTQAAAALRNYLVSGEPRWSEAMGSL